MWCFIDGVILQQVFVDLNCSERLRRRGRLFCSRARGDGFLRGRRVPRLLMHASAGDPDSWRDVARSVSGSVDAGKVKASRERPPPQWVAPPPGFELTSDSETSSSWACWRDATRAMRAEQQELQERVERGELIRDAEEERNFWRAAASELGAPAHVDRSAAAASTGSPLSGEESAVSGEQAGTGDEGSSIPDSDEEWDPDTSWLQSYAPVGMETPTEGEPADAEMQQTSWYSGFGSQSPDEGSAGSGDAERDQGWGLSSKATDVIRDAASEEEEFEPRDPKKETAFWRGAAQELIGKSTASESVDAPSDDFEPRDPKKETAFWRGAAQELIGSLAPSPERETEEQSSASVSYPDSSMDSAWPLEVSAEEPTDPAEVWAAWRSTQSSFSATPESSASVAETNWESLPDNERWNQWRDQQRKSWEGALDDLNRRHPSDRGKPRTEKGTIDRWREAASELWQSAPNPNETQDSS
ncbi:hypothetical protein CCYA_CCYA03G0808 [Cyanidiococcus yangmingshanensis]|nr:hypothetical protein CCYA_CCYA03G0808 [Cyanidiococcus yangmingshanensis]